MSETVDELRARLAMAPVFSRHKSKEWVALAVTDRDAIEALLARLPVAEADAAHWKANHDEQVRRKQGTAAFLGIARAHARGLRVELAAAEKARCVGQSCPIWCETCGGPWCSGDPS